MTPTLLGRWQTRIFLLATVGILISIPFGMGLTGFPAGLSYFSILFYVALLGIGWDVVYDQIQKSRWDRDWPAAYQLFAGLWELIAILFAVFILNVPGVEKSPFVILMHYSVVWLSVFIASQSLMRILFVRWRFFGGQWLG
ncbi:MAG: hypothetical protein AAF378_08475 [Cyanobacteria bacterium P01_A01_bin.84]